MDYACFFRREINVEKIGSELPVFDMFVSAYNNSDRVRDVFSSVHANRKIWIIHPEYCFSKAELGLTYESIWPNDRNEMQQVDALLTSLGDLTGKSLCIDITGFMRHVLIFLVAKLQYLGIKEFTAIYSEPFAYKKREDTSFSTTTSGSVGPIAGMRGRNSTSALHVDHLIISVGYDYKLIGEVARFKDHAKVHPLFAFPSLSADMFQQSALSSCSSGEVTKNPAWISNRKFAPANDPFATAEVVGEIIRNIDRGGSVGNIYLAPLATKVQALGFAVYWVWEGKFRKNGGVSILLPECLTYSGETSVGLKRVWSFTVELP
jgi:hypothetical protein